MPITIGKPKLAILETLLDFRLMTAETLNGHLFSAGTISDTQKHLRELEREGYLRRTLPILQTMVHPNIHQ